MGVKKRVNTGVRVVTNRKEWVVPGGEWKSTDLDWEKARTRVLYRGEGRIIPPTQFHTFDTHQCTVICMAQQNNV